MLTMACVRRGQLQRRMPWPPQRMHNVVAAEHGTNAAHLDCPGFTLAAGPIYAGMGLALAVAADLNVGRRAHLPH